jgi:hypothetical protein
MTRHGELQPASERKAVQCRNHRLGEALDESEQIVKVGRRDHERRIELGHVRASAEVRARARENHGGDRLRIGGPVQAFGDAFAHARAERIDRRIVEPDHGDGAM